MCRPKINAAARPLAAAVVLAAMLAGCSDLYYARRDSITLGAGDSVAANMAEQTVDPWPRYSGNPNIPADGQKMQAAVERYRTGKVTTPVDSMTLTTTNQPTQTNTQITTTGTSANGTGWSSETNASSTSVTATPNQ